MALFRPDSNSENNDRIIYDYLNGIIPGGTWEIGYTKSTHTYYLSYRKYPHHVSVPLEHQGTLFAPGHLYPCVKLAAGKIKHMWELYTLMDKLVT